MTNQASKGRAGVAPSLVREQRLQEQARYWAATKTRAQLEALRQAAPTPELAKHVRLALKWHREIEQIEEFGIVGPTVAPVPDGLQDALYRYAVLRSTSN